jgi:CBS domain containing-hemolysin-like protein
MIAVLLVGVFVVLVLCHGFFVAAEFSIIRVPTLRMAQLVAEGHRGAGRIKRILDEPALLDRYVTTVQVGMVLTSLLLGMGGALVAGQWLSGVLGGWFGWQPIVAYGVAVVLVLLVLLVVLVVGGEMVPRSLALQYAERVVLGVDGFMRVMGWLLWPLVVVPGIIGRGLLVVFDIPRGYTHRRLYSPEDLEQAISESHQGGLLSDDEQQIIQRIFDLDERRVGQVMTPRPRIVAVPLDVSEEQLRLLMVRSPHSRFPVYQESLDRIVGVLLVKDFVSQQFDTERGFDLGALVRQMPAVPEAMTCERLLAAFKRSHIHMALVFDEYGGTAGVVTLEDLVEEVVGDVHDEFDQVELPSLREMRPGVFLARGDLLLVDLYEAAPRSIPYEDDDLVPDVDTVGGLVVSLLGRPAVPGDEVWLCGTRFTVESVRGFAVDMVVIVPGDGDGPGVDASTQEVGGGAG